MFGKKKGNMMQKWKKIGLVFKPIKNKRTVSHCQHATPLKITESVYRIFYGSRNVNNLTQVFYFDIDLNSFKIINFIKKPLLILGEVGHFDQHGIYPSSIIRKGNQFLLFTIGFTQGASPLYYTRIGLAAGDQLEKLEKKSNVPLLNVSEHDPCTVTGPFVMFDNEIYRMWYVSGYKWDKNIHGDLQSYYHIKYAESIDAINWKREGIISIGHIHPGETNIARPWIIKEDGIYKAWFSYNCGKQGYRIGYAESRDGGYTFERMDHLAGISISDESWENEAVAYPAVVVHEGRKYMFYNGNKFGMDGIALAVEE